jgi:hypothetical protein
MQKVALQIFGVIINIRFVYQTEFYWSTDDYPNQLGAIMDLC